MRSELARFHGRKITVQGLFDHFGTYKSCQTALFQAIHSGEDFLCSHNHVQHAETMLAYDLRWGDRVQFSAFVTQYRKPTFEGYEIDYGLSHPMSVKILNRDFNPPSLVTADASDAAFHPPSPKQNRSPLVAEVERIAKDGGGYDAVQSALDYVRRSA